MIEGQEQKIILVFCSAATKLVTLGCQWLVFCELLQPLWPISGHELQVQQYNGQLLWRKRTDFYCYCWETTV